MDSPLLASPGAVVAESPDAGVAAHYGDPFAEQRVLAETAGMVDRSHRDVVRIGGQDRLGWLNDISTQKLDQLPPDTATQTLILSPHGHVEHHLTLVDDGTYTWAHVEPGEAKPLLDFLESMRFMLRVEPADVSADYAVLTLMGPDANTQARRKTRSRSGLRSAPIERLKAMAAERADTSATIIQIEVCRLGMPRAASTAPVRPKGRVSTECSHLIISRVVPVLWKIFRRTATY